jgi:hypothetical protein
MFYWQTPSFSNVIGAFLNLINLGLKVYIIPQLRRIVAELSPRAPVLNSSSQYRGQKRINIDCSSSNSGFPWHVQILSSHQYRNLNYHQRFAIQRSTSITPRCLLRVILKLNPGRQDEKPATNRRNNDFLHSYLFVVYIRTNFDDKRRSLGRCSSLAGSSHRV